MNPEQKLVAALVALFGVGLLLVAFGLGLTTKPAAFAVGLLISVAAIRFLAGGPKQ